MAGHAVRPCGPCRNAGHRQDDPEGKSYFLGLGRNPGHSRTGRAASAVPEVSPGSFFRKPVPRDLQGQHFGFSLETGFACPDGNRVSRLGGPSETQVAIRALLRGKVSPLAFPRPCIIFCLPMTNNGFYPSVPSSPQLNLLNDSRHCFIFTWGMKSGNHTTPSHTIRNLCCLVLRVLLQVFPCLKRPPGYSRIAATFSSSQAHSSFATNSRRSSLCSSIHTSNSSASSMTS